MRLSWMRIGLMLAVGLLAACGENTEQQQLLALHGVFTCFALSKQQWMAARGHIDSMAVALGAPWVSDVGQVVQAVGARRESARSRVSGAERWPPPVPPPAGPVGPARIRRCLADRP